MIVIHLPLWPGGSCHYISRYSTFLHGQVVPFVFVVVIRCVLMECSVGVLQLSLFSVSCGVLVMVLNLESTRNDVLLLLVVVTRNCL